MDKQDDIPCNMSQVRRLLWPWKYKHHGERGHANRYKPCQSFIFFCQEVRRCENTGATKRRVENVLNDHMFPIRLMPGRNWTGHRRY